MIEKIIIAIENDKSLTNLCYGTQQVTDASDKNLKLCYVKKFFDKFECEYKFKIGDKLLCKFKPLSFNNPYQEQEEFFTQNGYVSK